MDHTIVLHILFAHVLDTATLRMASNPVVEITHHVLPAGIATLLATVAGNRLKTALFRAHIVQDNLAARALVARWQNLRHKMVRCHVQLAQVLHVAAELAVEPLCKSD